MKKIFNQALLQPHQGHHNPPDRHPTVRQSQTQNQRRQPPVHYAVHPHPLTGVPDAPCLMVAVGLFLQGEFHDDGIVVGVPVGGVDVLHVGTGHVVRHQEAVEDDGEAVLLRRRFLSNCVNGRLARRELSSTMAGT